MSRPTVRKVNYVAGPSEWDDGYGRRWCSENAANEANAERFRADAQTAAEEAARKTKELEMEADEIMSEARAEAHDPDNWVDEQDDVDKTSEAQSKLDRAARLLEDAADLIDCHSRSENARKLSVKARVLSMWVGM